ncbi:hypothetical protein MKW94_016904 [Papaver nudicaule]|uniref:C2H2-type domain-containing protein n=1 Tax=Papaver nudicaule TaxID=74823 RepID=A0AA41S336_PAPNU|nr:hypothetical protein [Papaver nudicaule]
MSSSSSSIKSFTTFCSSLLILLLFHLGCFFFTTSTNRNHHQHDHDIHHLPNSSSNKKRKINPYFSPISSFNARTSNSNNKTRKSISSSWCFIKKIFSFKKHINHDKTTTSPAPSLSATRTTTTTTSASVTTQRPRPTRNIVDDVLSNSPSRKRRTPSSSSIAMSLDSEFSLIDHRSFPLRNDIFPCPTCGEIFQKPQLVEHHQSIKHAVTELHDDDSSKNIVTIIFKTGWNNPMKNPPTIDRILKIHNSPKILSRFEEYKELVKSKESRRSSGNRRRDERCIADGNELLRFHCSTFICNLGHNGKSSICSQQYCNVCGIIRSGFSPKLDGISTVSSSWRAHVSFPEELEKEFAFMNIKRVMLVCRVIAGRIGEAGAGGIVEKGESAGFDSVLGVGCGGGANSKIDEEDLLVFNPRAVLPCFAIVYNV